MLNIVVCMKLVQDPEAPVSSFKIDPESKRAIPAAGTPPVLNPFDENALEGALRLKAAAGAGGAKVTVISMGKVIAKAVMRKTYAVGADNLILLEDPVLDSFDPWFSATILAAAIKKQGAFDLVLCGRQAADTDAGQTGSGIAEILGIPSVTLARKVDYTGGLFKVERVLPDGFETLEVPAPVLVTATNEMGELRSAAVAALMAAQKKPITTWKATDLGLDVSKLEKQRIAQLFIPVRQVQCTLVTGGTPAEAGANLALKLKEAKLF
jgi:electron transfer flavoprotein beta subunit